jgi:hypothetical protein
MPVVDLAETLDTLRLFAKSGERVRPIAIVGGAVVNLTDGRYIPADDAITAIEAVVATGVVERVAAFRKDA